MAAYAGFPPGAPDSAQTVPSVRLSEANGVSSGGGGDYVLYWMTAYRRPHWNYALQHARDLALAHRRPLLVLEALRLDYPWASQRFHAFLLEGMADNARAFRQAGVSYAPYLERERGGARGLVEALAERACAVVTDHYPAFFIPRAQAALAQRLSVPLVSVDSNGLLPLRRATRAFPTAHGFRRMFHRQLGESLVSVPEADPLAGRLPTPLPELPSPLRDRFAVLSPRELSRPAALLEGLAVDCRVGKAPVDGGFRAARARLHAFVTGELAHYDEHRNHPDADGQSRLSPYLHFGQLSVHEVYALLAQRELDSQPWEPARAGKRVGFYRGSPAVQSFLDELLVWRELAFNGAYRLPDYDSYASLPAWARATLSKHASDPRRERYDVDRLEAAETGDPIWNAAQRELVRDGRMHNYLRMLWGKRILEWSESPERAFEVMVELNNRYALDGRDPNSYAGIAWVLGRYDRAWGPERPIFGTVRYMSSRATARKLRLREYLERYGPR